MRLKFFKPKLHIYHKVLLLFLLLLIPIFSVIQIAGIIGSNYLRNEISKSVMQNVDFYIKQLDKDIALIKRQQLQMLNNSDVLNLRNYPQVMGLFDVYLTTQRIKERLSVMIDSSSYLTNAGVYVNTLGRTISMKNGFVATPNDEFRLVDSCYEKTLKDYLNFSEEGIYLIEAYPKETEERLENKQIAIYAELSDKMLAEGLSSINEYDGSGGFLIDLEKNLSIKTSGSEEELHNKILELYSDMKETKQEAFEISYKGQNYWVVFKKSELLDMVVFSYFYSTSVDEAVNKFNLLFIILFTITVIILFGFSFIINLMVHRPLYRLMGAFKQLEEGNLEVSVKHRREDEFGYLFNAFNTMVRQLGMSIHENFEQKLALQQSELKQLQSQINPHFLYNCFFNISRMCKSEDYDDAMVLAQKLGSYYRYITRSGEDEVPLSVEYQNARDYVEIQSIRFANRIRVIMPELPEGYGIIKVPRIIMQPVLENAYEHAFEKSIDGGNIYISVKCEDKKLHIIIEDDGKFLSEESLEKLSIDLKNAEIVKEKTGIVNVCRRLQLKYVQGSGLFSSRSEYGGLKIDMIIFY